MGQIFSCSGTDTGMTVTVGNDIGALYTNATRSLRIKEAMFYGLSTTSIAVVVDLRRTTVAGGSPVSTMTVTPHNPNGGAAGFTTVLTSANATATTIVKTFGFNANGGIIRWVAPPGYEIEVPGGGSPTGFVLRPSVGAGSPVIGYTLIVEEF